MGSGAGAGAVAAAAETTANNMQHSQTRMTALCHVTDLGSVNLKCITETADSKGRGAAGAAAAAVCVTEPP